MDDLTVYMDDEELASTAKEMESTFVLGGAKRAAAMWVAVVGILAGALGGLTVSPAIRSSSLVFVGYLLVVAIVVRGFHPLIVRWHGRAIAWVAAFFFFWTFLLGLFAVLGARRESSLWAYVLSTGMGFFIGMMNGSFAPGSIRREDIWMSFSFPMAPLTATIATWWLRHSPGTADTLAGAAIGGGVASGLYAIIMSVAMVRLWNEAHGLSRMGVLYLHNDNFAPKAVAYLDRAIALAPNDAQLYNLRGIAWSKMNEPDKAAADWLKVLELSPNDPEPLVNNGADFLRQGNLDQAILALEKAVALDPKHRQAFNNLGTAYERKGELDLAIAKYDRAIELDGDYANAYSNRGYAHFRRGDPARSLADCERAIRLNSKLVMAHVNRGHALAALGRGSDAAGSYRAALDLAAEPSIREEALRGLEAVGEPYEVDADD